MIYTIEELPSHSTLKDHTYFSPRSETSLPTYSYRPITSSSNQTGPGGDSNSAVKVERKDRSGTVFICSLYYFEDKL